MKNLEILSLYNGLLALSNADVKLPGVINFVRKVNMNTLKPLVDSIHESYDDLLKKYGTTEDGVKYTVPEDKVEEFTTERRALEELEVEVDIQKFDASVLKTLDLEPKYFDVLFELANN